MSPICVGSKLKYGDDKERRKRSICETRTGGKSVKKEKGRKRNGVTKPEKKKAAPHLDNAVNPFSDVYKDDQQRWHYTNKPPSQRFVCNYPFDDNEEVPSGEKACGKRFKRTEHRQRHRRSHIDENIYDCRLCNKKFNRHDNCWQHANTHVARPGGKGGNPRFSLRQVISILTETKYAEKLLGDWEKDVGSEYIPEQEENNSKNFMEELERYSPGLNFEYDPEEAIAKIHRLRMQ
ncbi:hypothetical protein BDW02DRAFT_571776 [Decorospora gaudefroyi]|uniref:C2H2-type domain-containing protein n=1 Tax=Decorospora gaudefroyi TaxID=184978 RepID=A0A6A5K9F4_9PLEO|nr:hypothetical protein BDW02DRAFT_571776 [Decorospora gaudefroyi]